MSGLSIILLVSLFCCFVILLIVSADGLRSVRWPRASGRINRSEVVEYGGDSVGSFKACIEYDYTVDGRKYVGERIQFGQAAFMGLSRHRAMQIADQFRAGSAVEIAYHPSDPASSTLVTGLSADLVYALILTMAGMLAVAFWGVVT